MIKRGGMTIEDANKLAEEFHMHGTAFQNGDASFWREGNASKREPYHVYSHFYFAKELEAVLLKERGAVDE